MANKLQELFPKTHSDKVTIAARCVPTDVALNLSDDQLAALVANIIACMERTSDQLVAEYEKLEARDI
jgi:hypothetical protein